MKAKQWKNLLGKHDLTKFLRLDVVDKYRNHIGYVSVGKTESGYGALGPYIYKNKRFAFQHRADTFHKLCEDLSTTDLEWCGTIKALVKE